MEKQRRKEMSFMFSALWLIPVGAIVEVVTVVYLIQNQVKKHDAENWRKTEKAQKATIEAIERWKRQNTAN